MPDQANPSSSEKPGLPLSHSDALPAGTTLAEFEITGLLGVGGFGMVYSAYDNSLGRTVAIGTRKFTPLPGDFVKYDAGGSAQIQALDDSIHGNVDAKIAGFNGGLADTCSFVSKPDRQLFVSLKTLTKLHLTAEADIALSFG